MHALTGPKAAPDVVFRVQGLVSRVERIELHPDRADLKFRADSGIQKRFRV